jgi:hypothetical protein
MRKLKTPLRLIVLVLLAAATQASPQTVQSDPPTRQMVVHQTRKSGNSRSALATVPAALPGLCFQPGVGWRRNLPEQPGVPATGETNAPIAHGVNGSTGMAGPQSIDDRLFGDRLLSATQPNSTECAGISTNQRGLETGVEKFTNLNLSGPLRSPGSTKPGTLTALQVNSPHHGHGGAGRARVTPGIMPSTHFALGNREDTNPDQVGIRAYHAYISSIKLRRWIRNAPDFRTRSKLQQLENPPQSHKARVDTKKGARAGRPREGERVSRSSSRKSDASDQAQNPQALPAGADR